MIDRASLLNMPCTIRSFAKKTAEPDGDYYTIVVNARHTREMNRDGFCHEDEHIEDEEFYNEGSADYIELQKH